MTQQQLESALQAQGFTFEQYKVQLREQLERLRLVSIEVRSKVYVSDREAEAYYEANKQKYAEDERFRPATFSSRSTKKHRRQRCARP